MSPTRSSLPVILDAAEPGVADALFSAPFGLFGKQKIRAMIGRKLIRRRRSSSTPSQLQPASLDLRISKEAYRVRASFLPGTRMLGARPAAKPQRRAGVARGQGGGAREGHRLCRASASSGSSLGPTFPAPRTRRARPAGSTSSPASSSTAPRRSTTCRWTIRASFGSRSRRAASACGSRRGRN